MAQNRQKRRAYDQTKDIRRPSQSGSARRASQRSGYEERTITFGTAGQQPQQRRAVNNGVEFPAQQRASGGARTYQGQGANRRPAQNAAAARRPQNGQRAARGASRAQNPAPAAAPAVRREKRKQRRVTRAELRRRRIMRRVTAFALLLCVIAAGVYLTMTMLFKINSIEVQTADGAAVSEAGGYSSAEILQALGVQLDDNIFSFDAAAKAAALEKQFPLLEQIEVVRKYPTSVVVRVTEATPAWAMQTSDGWLTISSTLKIIDEDSQRPSLPTLYGGEPLYKTPGEQLAFAPEAEADASSASVLASASAQSAASAQSESDGEQTDTKLAALNTLLTALNERGLLGDVTRIEFADTEQLAFLYQDRISVLLGTLNELDYKLDFAKYLLLNTDGKGCAATDTGELDCSHVRSDGTLQPILAQGEPTLPSGYVVSSQPEAASEAAAETAEDAAADTAGTEAEAADTAGAQTAEAAGTEQTAAG